MTRKDFELIASSLWATQPPKEHEAAYTQWVRDVGQITYALKQTNVRFDSKRFQAACQEGMQ